MKCEYCNGLIIFEKGICQEPDRWKCLNCGRGPKPKGEEVNIKMEEKIKKCTKCLKEKPANIEVFYADKKNKDGLSYWCRDCNRLRRKESAMQKKSNQKSNVKNNSQKRNFRTKYLSRIRKSEKPHLTVRSELKKATPEEIVTALEKGYALKFFDETIDAINRIRERYIGEGR